MNSQVFFTVFVSFLMFLSLPGIVEAGCSIGANPLSMDARATPGQTVTATWNLYNIHGDRITHVKVSPSEPMPGWEIIIDPLLHNATYNVSNVLQTVEENVGLEPSQVAASIPGTIPEGMDYVRHPDGENYIPVKPVKIYVMVPETAEPWKDYNLTFEALGSCFMEPGAAIPAIATQLELNIKVVSESGFFEERVTTPATGTGEGEGGEAGEATEGAAGAGEEGGITDSITGFFVANSAWIGIVIILVIVVLYLAFVRKAGREEGYTGYSYTPK